MSGHRRGSRISMKSSRVAAVYTFRSHLAFDLYLLPYLFLSPDSGLPDVHSCWCTTGKGQMHEDLECNHHMKDYDAGHVPLRLPKARQLLGS